MHHRYITIALLVCAISAPITFGQILPGGWYDIDANDSTVENLSKRAIDLYGTSQNDSLARRLISVVRARTQVVAGSNYNVTLILGVYGCSDGDFNSSSPLCVVDELKTCQFLMYYVPWTNTLRLTSSLCLNSTSAWSSYVHIAPNMKKALNAIILREFPLRKNRVNFKLINSASYLVHKLIYSIYATLKRENDSVTFLFCKMKSENDIRKYTKCTLN
ncbi:hypothetical protein HELRODRAFT_177742 [Helobdella robusta]|uniref:Cystatin domain-containing protein n=1 Tax=Helobdella robusta TaxID=6412 RepID=T1FC62_HELRO|nr:hypothetical protein HELRODRAFT_177742 [Helobdella robusta]ESN97687.1 hypothetical protein HELRODRAFT_177742 [Helobdella robusta]